MNRHRQGPQGRPLLHTQHLTKIQHPVASAWRAITTRYLGDTIHAVMVQEALARAGRYVYPPEGYPIRDIYMPLFEGCVAPLVSSPNTVVYLDVGTPWRGPEHGKHIRDTFRTLMFAETVPKVMHLPIKTDRVRGMYVVLCPFASTPKKEWKTSEWAKIAEDMQMRGYKVYVNQNPDRDTLPMPRGVEHIYPDLVTLAKLLQDAAAVVSVDSGHLHLSDAMGNAPVGLYGTTGAATYAPYNDARFVIDHHKAQWNMGIPYNSGKHAASNGLGGIKIEEVFTQLNRRLAED